MTPEKTSPQERMGKQRGFGRFLTTLEIELPSGELEIWKSRTYRKRDLSSPTHGWGVWWAPTSRSWWIGVLFAIGSFLFALGAVPSYARLVHRHADALTFFVGSLFFTSAAFLQYRESAEAVLAFEKRTASLLEKGGLLRIGWLACLVQLVGTFFFNISTAGASLTHVSQETLIDVSYRPDLFGSICFLVASLLAWIEVSDGWWSWSPGEYSWWVTVVNLLGSVAFGVSAIAPYLYSFHDSVKANNLSNLGTFVGAVFFLLGAVLLLPERGQGASSSA